MHKGECICVVRAFVAAVVVVAATRFGGWYSHWWEVMIAYRAHTFTHTHTHEKKVKRLWSVKARIESQTIRANKRHCQQKQDENSYELSFVVRAIYEKG